MQALTGEIHKPGGPVEQAQHALEHDDVAGSEAILEQALANKPEPAASFVLANLMYRSNAQEAAALHEKLWRSAPDDPFFAFEWAMDLHRADRCADAIAPYAVALKAMPAGSPQHALYAHCLLVVGRYAEAVAEWEKADHPHKHVSIEELFSAVYFKPEPWHRRPELRAAAAQGDVHAWLSVLLFDLALRRIIGTRTSTRPPTRSILPTHRARCPRPAGWRPISTRWSRGAPRRCPTLRSATTSKSITSPSYRLTWASVAHQRPTQTTAEADRP